MNSSFPHWITAVMKYDFPNRNNDKTKNMRKNFGSQHWLFPQPVLMIATYNEDGTPDIMNAAWGGQWDAKEIMISMGAHATTDNLNNCPDFTVAFATKQTMVAADFVGIVSAKNDTDKMAKTGWKWEKAENVNAPVFTDFPMTLECRIKEKIDESEEGYYIVVIPSCSGTRRTGRVFASPVMIKRHGTKITIRSIGSDGRT